MKYITREYSIGTPIEVPKDVADPRVTITQRSATVPTPNGGKELGSIPVAILCYIELTDEEKREVKARQARHQLINPSIG